MINFDLSKMMACQSQSQEDDYHHYWVYFYDDKEEERGRALDWNLGCSFGEEETGVGGVLDVGTRFLDDDEHMSLAMESPVNWSDQSSGYLEDAVVEWADERCKRRRVEVDSFNDVPKEFWNLNSFNGDQFSDFDSFSDSDTTILGGDPFDNSASIKKPIDTEDMNSDLQQFQPIRSSSSSSSQENSTTAMSDPISKPNSEDNIEKKKEKRKNEDVVMIGVLYPFTVVRPGGTEGVVTLDDINKRVLRRPTRPIRHPVGEFRCLPCTSAATGLGISGKAVVGLTRIHTVGRGTVTIIRTRG